MTIVAGGTGSSLIRSTNVYSRNSKNINITVQTTTNNNVVRNLRVYAQDLKGNFNFFCGSDCNAFQVWCPWNSSVAAKDNDASCTVDCSTSGVDCTSMNLYTYYGIPKDVKFSVKKHIFICLVFCQDLQIFIVFFFFECYPKRHSV